MIIREAIADDAEQIIAHVQRLAYEPQIMVPHAPGEFQITAEQEQKLLEEYATADNSLYLVAAVEGRVIGILHCKGGTRQATRHAASLGISIAQEWRGKGVGTALMNHLIVWSQNTGIIKRLELGVYAHNEAAIHLYQKFGFVEEGKQHKAYFQHGHFIDSILMARLLP